MFNLLFNYETIQNILYSFYVINNISRFFTKLIKALGHTIYYIVHITNVTEHILYE